MSFIISQNYLTENSIINGNTDMKIITPTIKLCQDKYIKPILGTDLFNEILGQITANTVTALNQTLLDDYILPCFLSYIVFEATPVFKYRYANKGVMVKNSENSQSIDFNEMRWLMDKWKNDAEWYAEQTTKYLVQYSSSYPLYLANTTCDKIQPNSSNYQTGIYLD